MRQQKIRVDLYLTPQDYVFMVKYGETHLKKNMTQVVESILERYKDYEKIVKQLHIEAEKKKAEDMKKAEVIKK
jgi:hypothetical protein